MRVTKLLGLPVVDLSVARVLGFVSDALLDPATGRVEALDVQPRDGTGERVAARRVRCVGSRAVMLQGGATELLHSAGDNEHWVNTQALVGLEVLTDSGDGVGHLADAHFNTDTLAIEAYELATPFWERWLGVSGLIRPEEVLACSSELMIVPSARSVIEEEEAVPRIEIDQDGAKG